MEDLESKESVRQAELEEQLVFDRMKGMKGYQVDSFR